MTITTDALIIGGGLMGCSIAFQLAERNISTLLVERNALPGKETTARSGAIIRAHYGVPELVKLAQAANLRYLRFEDEVGESCGFTQCGYIVLVDDGDVSVLKANTAMHRDFGVDVSLIPPSGIGDIVPTIMTDDVALASYEPLGGYANPSMTVGAYAKRAEQLGAKFRYNSTIESAKLVGSGWEIVLANGEQVSSEHVILATGNWSQGVGKHFHIDLPVSPIRAQIVVTDRPGNGEHMPVVSDLINLAYFREEGEGGMWIGSSDMSDLQEKLPIPDGFNEKADIAAIEKAVQKAKLRFKSLPGVYPSNVQRAFTGLYETTPDWQPIIDQLPGNIHVAVGFSGHGFKLAPVIGDIVADAVAGKPTNQEVDIFRLSRFAEGKQIKSQHSYQRARFLR